MNFKIELTRILNAFGLNPTRSTPNAIVLDTIFKIKPIESNLVRVGPQNDGGYFLPKDFNGVSYAFSPGSNGAWGFEKDLGDNYGIHSFIIDKEIKAPQGLTKFQSFRPGLLGPYNSSEYITLETWIESTPAKFDNELILQMDIEGAEFSCLLTTPDYVLNKFRIIVVEFHNLNWLLNYPYFKNCVGPTLEKLLIHFSVVSVHPNNSASKFKFLDFELPQVIEVTFHRKDRVRNVTPLSLKLDSKSHRNNLSKKDLEIDWTKISRSLKK